MRIAGIVEIGDVIQFRYKGNRFVKGVVSNYTDKLITVKLLTDYIGKNQEWEIGENKIFNRSEMTKIEK